ncbi:MAG: hypothetical protein QOF63_3359 [Thermoanaerobaculia bacterium]|jgi:hypothetical protein|nr:hypothetical protein [Thermoanaerobaculia bacterium]
MATIQPIRHFVLTLAGKVIRGEPFTEREVSTLEGFRSAFPDLQNPLHIRCSIPDHTVWGVLAFPGDSITGGGVGNIEERDGGWVCTHCGNGDKVRQDVVRVI